MKCFGLACKGVSVWEASLVLGFPMSESIAVELGFRGQAIIDWNGFLPWKMNGASQTDAFSGTMYDDNDSMESSQVPAHGASTVSGP